MFLSDNYKDCEKVDYIFQLPKKFGLFVGSLFYANYFGIKWFSENVCPYINVPILVVGKGFERLKEEFQNTPNLSIIGEVPDLAPYYNYATFIVSPIFDGSGMKTKTAEALMYGKWIIGTSEAFEGYKIINGITGLFCDSKEDFITAINNYKGERYIPSVRQLFKANYSLDVITERLNSIILKLINNESFIAPSK